MKGGRRFSRSFADELGKSLARALVVIGGSAVIALIDTVFYSLR